MGGRPDRRVRQQHVVVRRIRYRADRYANASTVTRYDIIDQHRRRLRAHEVQPKLRVAGDGVATDL